MELMLQLRALLHQILDSVAAGVNQEFSDSLYSEQSRKKKRKKRLVVFMGKRHNLSEA